MKECFKCNKSKPLSEFYKHAQMADGHVNKCKECNKKDVRENRKAKVEYYREYDRARGNRQTIEYLNEYRAAYPKKYKAHTAVNNAIRSGKLKRETSCTNCDYVGDIHAHHDDYNFPLSVRWLCAPCHKKWHKDNGEGANPI